MYQQIRSDRKGEKEQERVWEKERAGERGNVDENRRNDEVGGRTQYHKVFLARHVAHTMLGTVILLYRCTLFQPLYTCTCLQLFALHSTATWRQPGISFVNETSQGFTKHQTQQKRIMQPFQILNFDWGDQSKVLKYFKWRRPPMEDNLSSLQLCTLYTSFCKL